MADFDDVRLPSDIEKGATMGPEFDTTVVALVGGNEQRNRNRSQELLRANVGYGIMPKYGNPQHNEGVIRRRFADILAFFRARAGKARGFRFKDWTDFEATNEFLAVTDGVTQSWQLFKAYGTGEDAYIRRITRPVVGSLTVFVDGVSKPFTLGALGVVTLTGTAPVAGQDVTWSGEFDVPVRFNTDLMQVQLQTALAGEIPNIEIVGLPE